MRRVGLWGKVSFFRYVEFGGNTFRKWVRLDLKCMDPCRLYNVKDCI